MITSHIKLTQQLAGQPVFGPPVQQLPQRRHQQLVRAVVRRAEPLFHQHDRFPLGSGKVRLQRYEDAPGEKRLREVRQEREERGEDGAPARAGGEVRTWS